MSCECHQVGGRFIAEDPSCPIHGTEAQRDALEREAREARLEHVLARVRSLAEESCERGEHNGKLIVEALDELNDPVPPSPPAQGLAARLRR